MRVEAIKNFYSKLNFIIFCAFVFAWIGSCASAVRFAGSQPAGVQKIEKRAKKFYVGQVLTGKCSYYASKFHGRKTASGEVYDMFAMTAAHRSLPFNTILEVENLANHKKVRVRVNDRGPFKPGRILDLSLQAARELGFIKQGTAEVRAVIIKLGDKE